MNDDTLSATIWLRTAQLGCVTLFFLLPLGLSQAQEALSVQEVLADPALFHLRQVTLKGTVRQIQPLDPYEIPAGSTCYGGYLFNLEDDTATLSIAVPGLCGIPMVKDPDVEDGARVVVDATIQAPSHGGYALSFKGSKIAMDQEGVVQAIANRITPLVE
ncbi:MAG: hypothetical protein JSR62_05190 [Nitrospira sp.]|nr:hypothetical protein [Nitrospira sp.]